MYQLSKASLRWVLTLGILSVILFFGYVPPVHAQGIITGDTVPAGQTVENDAILFGDQVKIEGNVDGNVIAIGNGVTVNGKVTGNIVIISQQALITGEVTDSIYALSLLFEMGDTAKIGRNLAYVGGSLTMYPGSYIGRDLTGLFFGATMSGEIGRDVRAVIGPVEIVRLFVKTFNIDIKLPENLPWKTQSFHQPGAAKLAVLVPARMLQETGPTITNELLTNWIISRLKEFITLLIIGLLLIVFFPAFLDAWNDSLRAAPMLSLSYGLVIAIVGNVGGFLVLLLAIALGLGIMALGLSVLGFMLGALGTLAVGLSYSVFLLFLSFLSKILVAYFIGSLILKRFEKPSRWYKILPFLLGLLIYVLAASIPFLGWVISVLASFIGIGAIWKSMFSANSAVVKEAEVL